MKYKKPPAEASGFLVTYCALNWNTLIIGLKRWSTVLNKAKSDKILTFLR
jgi:hypothetical protein